MSEKKISSGAEKAESLEKKTAAKDKNGQGANSAAKAETAEKSKNSRNEQLMKEKKEAEKNERIAKTEEAKARKEARRNAELAAHEKKLKEKEEKRNIKKERTPGFGGWLAAVIALGVTTLALGTMLTFGWINYNGMQAGRADDASHSLYELNAIVDNLDANLSKARVAQSAGDRARIFTDIAVESELAESAIERLPVAGDLTRSMTAFINKVGESAQNMIYTVARGEDLSSSQTAAIEYMYECNKQIKEFLNGLTTNCCRKDMIAALDGKGAMFDGFEGYIDPAVETPKEIYDGPFAENTKKVSAKDLDGMEEISPERAEELAGKYFADYGVTDVRCTGETKAEQLTCYNVTMNTEDGEYFAQFSKSGGKLVMFDSHKDCSQKNFSVKNCKTIAENFLESIGYKNLTCVWAGENGTACNLNYVYEQDGAAVYPDMIKVKVCEERGIVTGIEALPYVLNHTKRSVPFPALSKAQVQKKLGGKLDIESSRLAIIPFNGGEKLAYEFCGTYGGNTYYVYLDANSGTELNVFTVVGNQMM